MSAHEDDPRPGAMDPTADPRPWWFREFTRDLFRRLDRQDEQNDRRFDEVERHIDTLERDVDERRGSVRQRSSAFTGGIALITTIIAVSGLVVTIIAVAFR